MVNDESASWVRVSANRAELGVTAAADIAAELRQVLTTQGHATVVFAAAPSQRETLTALAAAPDIDWSAVTAFHMDEYLGLDPASPQRFGNWLRDAFFDHLPLRSVHLIGAPSTNGATASADSAVASYTALLAETPIDIVCLGIGSTGTSRSTTRRLPTSMTRSR